METKTIYWNELSEQTKLVLPTVKITHSIENGCSVLMFEPEKKETFLVGEIVEYKELPGTYTFAKTDGILLDVYNKTTLEEKDAFLLTQNKMISENGEVLRWKPKYGQQYFIPSFGNVIQKYIPYTYAEDSVDNRYFEDKMMFSTIKLAIEAHDKMLNSLK